ncbi:hypothetical protein [Haloquadratum walsbyi]|jgi:hypothetical protein|uniref:Uncharacterized protein n=1 Tax=Haloquadratum walsbyi J07HQW2 TaxID=1238425 RepID=U1PT32_9EURY|nr:hypothetical protein [Haloquadratum walsbyi]ERG95531.1 MAG: hypothetical protein J07HQW2_01989 [Haloquadratum walsbyi J07HQW2]
MADALVNLGIVSDTQQYITVATDALAAFAGARERLGVQVAGYRAVTARATRVVILLRMGVEVGSDLHCAVLRIADHEAIVVPNADIQDDTPHLIHGSETETETETETATTTTPDELMKTVSVLTH